MSGTFLEYFQRKIGVRVDFARNNGLDGHILCVGGVMISRLVVAFFLLLAMGLASAGERTFVPVPSEGQSLEYDDGEAFLVARLQNSVVMVSYVARDKKSAFLKVGVRNVGETSFNFSETDVTAVAGGSALQVMTYADRLKEEKRSQMWAAVGAGFAAAANSMNAANAGYSNTYGSYSGRTTATAYGSGGYASATGNSYGNFSARTYDSTAAYLAQQSANAQNQALLERQQANAEFSKRSLEARALKANTLSPGEMVLGDVRLALPKRNKSAPAEFVATVKIDGQSIALLFREQQ